MYVNLVYLVTLGQVQFDLYLTRSLIKNHWVLLVTAEGQIIYYIQGRSDVHGGKSACFKIKYEFSS